MVNLLQLNVWFKSNTSLPVFRIVLFIFLLLNVEFFACINVSFTRYVIRKCCHLVAKSCPTLLQPHGLKPPGSSVHGILQARLLEWAAIPFSVESSQPKDPTCVSCCSCLHWQVDSLLLSHQIKYYPAPTPVFWPGEFHGQRKLAGYIPWGHKESDMPERLMLSHSQKY